MFRNTSFRLTDRPRSGIGARISAIAGGELAFVETLVQLAGWRRAGYRRTLYPT